jgi:Tfp pilus assembly protein PilV
MSKRGTTLIESVIAIFLTSVVVLTFLESLNVGMTGTLQLSRKTSAINIAQSQMEYIKAQTFNSSNGSIADVYGLVTAPNASNTSDVINYNISGTVTNISASLQKITVNVSYLQGKQVQLISYKAARTSVSHPPAQGQIVTDVVADMPFIPPGGWGFLGWGKWMGYYHVFYTTQTAKISATWRFYWVNEIASTPILCAFTWGAPYIGIYAGIPSFAERDYLGNVFEDGIVLRSGSFLLSGCMPGCSCPTDGPGDFATIIMHPGCGIDCGEDNWTYEHNSWLLCIPFDCPENGYFEFTVTTASAVPAGTYTVLFFNGEDRLHYETISASVTYIY